MSDGGKGSSPRPYSVNQEEYASSWDRIFSPKKQPVEGLKESQSVVQSENEQRKQVPQARPV